MFPLHLRNKTMVCTSHDQKMSYFSNAIQKGILVFGANKAMPMGKKLYEINNFTQGTLTTQVCMFVCGWKMEGAHRESRLASMTHGKSSFSNVLHT